MKEILNKVAKSSLVSIDLESYIHKGNILTYDIKEQLHQGLLLREKDFREFIKTHDWTQYMQMNVGLICSTEAIVPVWAYMLLAAKLKNIANIVTFGDKTEVEKAIIRQAINKCLSDNDIQGKKVIVKGCGNLSHQEYAITRLASKCFDKVSSLMYGEPCSTVPIFKSRPNLTKL